VLIIVISIFLVLKSKVTEQKDSLSLVKDAQEKLENKSIQLDEKLIQVLEQKLEAANLQPQAVDEADHSLPLTMGNEIHRMRNRLKTMDESSHAVRVLNNRLEKLEEAIKDKGYEIVDLERKTYNAGMNVQPHFVTDSNLKDGESIITRVIKPQINFKEKLIQVAEVEVSQG
jgi:predicted  nucleic acid-binding Zn-ribbon protein